MVMSPGALFLVVVWRVNLVTLALFKYSGMCWLVCLFGSSHYTLDLCSVPSVVHSWCKYEFSICLDCLDGMPFGCPPMQRHHPTCRHSIAPTADRQVQIQIPLRHWAGQWTVHFCLDQEWSNTCAWTIAVLAIVSMDECWWSHPCGTTFWWWISFGHWSIGVHWFGQLLVLGHQSRGHRCTLHTARG